MLLSPLCKWADAEADNLNIQKAKAEGKVANAADTSAFYFLKAEEMTFDKERNPPPPVTEHHIKFFADGDFASSLVKAVNAAEGQQKWQNTEQKPFLLQIKIKSILHSKFNTHCLLVFLLRNLLYRNW